MNRIDLTDGQIRIMWHQFESEICPTCNKWKQKRWCFCRGCYHALKHAKPKLAAGLWHEAFDGTNEFFESYQRSKAWLAHTGLEKSKHEQGGLFA